MKHCLIFLAAIFGALNVHAHTLSNSYLSLVVSGPTVTGRWDVAVRDLEQAVGVDENLDGRVTWGELKKARSRIETYCIPGLKLEMGSPVPLRTERFMLDIHSDGAYVVFYLTGKASQNDASAPLSVRYNLLFETDARHRGLLTVRFDQETTLNTPSAYDSATNLTKAMLSGRSAVAVFSPESKSRTFTPEIAKDRTSFLEFLRGGIWHIWIGFDHLAFLLVLLMPAVVAAKRGRWESIDGFRTTFVNAVKIVTAFSVAHSITLTAAALGKIELPSRLVESVIAASIVWGAASILRPQPQKKAWMIAFGFGLIHGFGFASVLGEFAMSKGATLWVLIAFNLGVELGQLAVVFVFLPLAFGIRKTRFYSRHFLRWAPVSVGVLGLVWFIERAFNVHFPS